MENNFIGDEGAGALAGTLKMNRALTSLNVQNNAIGDEGAIALAESLKTNKAFTSLKVESNSIGEKGACGEQWVIASRDGTPVADSGRG